MIDPRVFGRLKRPGVGRRVVFWAFGGERAAGGLGAMQLTLLKSEGFVVPPVTGACLHLRWQPHCFVGSG
jgi:hypothetical protein